MQKIIYNIKWRQAYKRICKLAVQQNGYALAYVLFPTEKICKLAVQQNGLVLKYVPTEEICKMDVQQHDLALKKYVPIRNISNVNITWLQKIIYNKKWKQAYKRICKSAVKQNGLALKYVDR